MHGRIVVVKKYPSDGSPKYLYRKEYSTGVSGYMIGEFVDIEWSSWSMCFSSEFLKVPVVWECDQ